MHIHIYTCVHLYHATCVYMCVNTHLQSDTLTTYSYYMCVYKHAYTHTQSHTTHTPMHIHILRTYSHLRIYTCINIYMGTRHDIHVLCADTVLTQITRNLSTLHSPHSLAAGTQGQTGVPGGRVGWRVHPTPSSLVHPCVQGQGHLL